MQQDVIMLTAIIIFIVGLFAATTNITIRAKGFKRLYWLFCSLLIGFGSLTVIYYLAFPEQSGLPTGTPSGEMPAAIGLAGLIIRLGISAALIGFIVMALRRLILLSKKTDAG